MTDITHMGVRVEEEAVLPKMTRKKSKKKNNEADASIEVGNFKDTLPNRMDDGFELNNEYSKCKKDKKKHGVFSAGVDNIHQKENDEKKKRKKRKLEAADGKGALENETHLEGEVKRTSHSNEAEKDKNRHKKSRKKNGSDIVLSSAEINLDNNERATEAVRGQKNSDIQLGVSCGEVVKRKDFAEVDGIYNKEKDEKKKRKKRKLETYEEKNASKIETPSKGEEERTLLCDADEDGWFKPKEDKKKRIKKSRKNDGSDVVLSSLEIHLDESDREIEAIEGQEREDISKIENGEEGFIEKLEKKKKKKRTKKNDVDELGAVLHLEKEDISEIENVKERFKEKVEKKKQKKNSIDELGTVVHENMVGETGNNESSDLPNINKTLDKETRKGNKGKKKLKSVENNSEEPKSKVKAKKVRFSGHVEIFPLADDPSSGNDKNQDKDLVQGKRFSPEEDEIVKEAVYKYIEEHGLGKEGLDMVLHCKSHPDIKNCWKEIALVLPHRPHKSIYYRAHILFERAKNREWTPEEIELVRKMHKQHGPEWKKMADTLGKHRVHVKDTWRRIKLPNMKKGHWSQVEYQNLFDSVNLDLRMKAFEEKKSKHGMLRDNIAWTAISEKLSTRSVAICCMKWYQQLTSSMVAEGLWSDTDDYHLLIALFSFDACCIEDVDWDNLLEHRSGDICRKRWNQMVRHLGQHANKSFAEQVEILSDRYCPDLLEAREVWDSKPVVP